jgi:hypothetical protein
MINQSARLQSYGSTRTVHREATTKPLTTTRNHRQSVPHSHFLPTYGFSIFSVSYKAEIDIDIFLYTADTVEVFIDISEICEI